MPVSSKKRKNRNRKLKQEVLQKQLDEFFADKSNFDILYNCVNQQSGVSLRALEFLCTKLAPQKGVLFRNKLGELVDLNARYIAWISSSRKQYFDFFRRNKKNRFSYTRHGKSVTTTMGQLRFFVFAIKEGVYEYAKSKMQEIDKLMADVLSKETDKRKEAAKRLAADSENNDEEQQPPPRKKRRIQSGKASVACGSTQPVTLSFNNRDG